MGFSGLWVVWSPLGAPGEKKRENQMYLQAFAPLRSRILSDFGKKDRNNKVSIATSEKKTPRGRFLFQGKKRL